MNSMKIGNVQISGRVFYAPMAGISDLVFRRICRKFGAALTVSEMVSAKAMFFENAKTYELLATDEAERPVAVQIFGSDAHIMGKIAARLDNSNFDIIDINMCCPAPKIVKNGEGSALLRDPLLLGRIVKSVSAATSKPVTAKICLGFDFASKNYLEVAKVIEANGGAAIAVHGRVRPQMNAGPADWEAIAAIKNTVSIPVIGNGDIDNPEISAKRLAESGVDAIMIGRAASGNPWIFQQCNHYIETGGVLAPPTPQERIKTALEHALGLMELKGREIALLEMRKHLAWYTKGLRGATEARVRINQSANFDEIKMILAELLQNNEKFGN